MSYDTDEDSETYAACAHCGKTVFAGVFECPYCFKDPSGEDFPCAKCGRELPTGVVECPYCKSYTGDRGNPIPRRLPTLYVVGAVVLIVLILLAALLHPWG